MLRPAIGLLAVLAVGSSNGVSLPSRAFDSYRLPNTTVPTHYTLHLDTNIDAGIFDYTGHVQIQINVLEDVDQIVLHSVRNVITQLTLRNSAQLVIPVTDHEFDEDKEFLVVNVGLVLAAGSSYELDIQFTNSIDRNDLSGFYRASYVDDLGVTRYLGLTQFESVDARTSFPCYDEPGIKTTFDISITCGLSYHARSNSAALGFIITSDGRKLTTFKTTPRMQTYLVAWLISDFATERQVLDDPQLAVSTWARPNAQHLLSYSVDASVRFIRELESYFDEHYTMTKLDNVGIKAEDYAASAMENWGLVTYRETSLLYDPETQDSAQQRAVMTNIGHEFTHLFFGNLLAPKWWSFLWLNEGFARLYQYYVGSISHPEFNLRELFVTNALQTAFNADGSSTIRPMTYYVDTRAAISSLFDRVVYEKSASVLRMMSYALGETTFQKGLRYYIQQNKASGVVDENDLFNALDQAAKEDAMLPLSLSVHEVFGSWSHQAGVPEVFVRRNGNEYIFSQSRFFTTPQDDPNDSSWWIPISYSTESDLQFETLPAFWMPPGVSDISYEIQTGQDEIVVINPRSTGYYRVRYDEPLLDQLIDRLNVQHKDIPRTARARLIDDSLSFAHAGSLSYEKAFELMSYLTEETEYTPWALALDNLKLMEKMLRGNDESAAALKRYSAKLSASLLATHGVDAAENESIDVKNLRSIAIELGCTQETSCTSTSKRFAPKGSSYVTVNTQSDSQLLCHELKKSNNKAFDEVLSALTAKTDAFNRHYLVSALACTEQPEAIQILLNNLSKLYANERSEIVGQLASNSVEGLRLVLQFLSSDDALEILGINDKSLTKMLETVAEYTVSEADAVLLNSIVKRAMPIMQPKVQEQLSFNQKWVSRNAAAITAALQLFV